jgi:hypothetical protein
MTLTTETYWAVDGVPLQTYAYNIATLGEDRAAPPPLRGDNIQIPYKPGTYWVPRVPDSQVITLGMWVQGSNEDGTIPQDEDVRRVYDRNWTMLKKLFWVYDRELTLTKRMWVETSRLGDQVDEMEIEKQGDWSLIEVVAKAGFRGGLVPNMTSPARSAFTVDLQLSDPFYYSPQQIMIDFSVTTGVDLPGPVQTFDVIGDVLTTDINLAMEGPLVTPRFTISNYERVPWIEYQTEILDGDTATISVKDWSAEHSVSGDDYHSSGYVRHFGAAPWLWLRPGSTTVQLTAQETTGVGSLSYRPAWL